MQNHFLTLTSPPSMLGITNDQSSSIVGSIQTSIVVRTIGSSLALRLPALKRYGIVSSTHLTDEPCDDLQQLLNSFDPGAKIQ